MAIISSLEFPRDKFSKCWTLVKNLSPEPSRLALALFSKFRSVVQLFVLIKSCLQFLSNITSLLTHYSWFLFSGFFLLKKLTIFSKFFNVFYVYDWFNCINSPPSCVLDSTGSSHYLSLCSQSCCYLQSRDSTLVNLIHFALYCGDAVARSSLELVSGCAALNAQDSVGM